MTQIDSLRIYCEVYEQGLDFKSYLDNVLCDKNIMCDISVCYLSKNSKTNSIFSRLTQVKNYDLLISAISGNDESILLAVEYSAAVPTDDHIMQRSDGEYWCAKYNVPYLKISPTVKRMDENKGHGGGNKISWEFEQYVALKSGLPYYKINWNSTIDNPDLLSINSEKLSCIQYSEDLYKLLLSLIEAYIEQDDKISYFSIALNNYNSTYLNLKGKYNLDKIKEIFPNSTRLRWSGDNITVKINRFGHAMDPDRGIVYFMSMLLGRENVISEFQMQRDGFECNGGYGSLYDRISNYNSCISEMRGYYNKGNVISPKEAFSLFLKATNLNDVFTKSTWSANNRVNLNSEELMTYLGKDGGISHKFLFLLSKKIILSDQNRDVLVSIEYDGDVVNSYLNSLNTIDKSITKIHPILKKEITEDLITFASAELYKKSNIALLAVSYPGAQGDRCILIPSLNGSGRKVERKYIDVVGYISSNNHLKVYLQENKKNLSESASDCNKLNELKSKHNAEIHEFVRKTCSSKSIDAIILGVGAEQPQNIPAYDVNYIMTFNFSNISSSEIFWNIWICDTKLIDDFKDIISDDGKLRGTLKLPTTIFAIDKLN